MPGLADQRKEGEGGGLQQQSQQERVPAADPVDDRAGGEAGGERGDGARRKGQARGGE